MFYDLRPRPGYSLDVFRFHSGTGTNRTSNVHSVYFSTISFRTLSVDWSRVRTSYTTLGQLYTLWCVTHETLVGPGVTSPLTVSDSHKGDLYYYPRTLFPSLPTNETTTLSFDLRFPVTRTTRPVVSSPHPSLHVSSGPTRLRVCARFDP